MLHFIKLILVTSLIFANDGEGPLFTNLIPISDFFYGDEIQIDIQAIDKDGIDQVILYYKLNSNESYKNIIMNREVNYSAIISGFEATSNKIEYYFLGIDTFGNQRLYPDNPNSNPLSLPILKEQNNSFRDYEVTLIEPFDNSKPKDISIIILSIYSQHKNININNIKIELNNQDITKDCNISNDLITYVPFQKMNNGSYELIFQITDNKEPFIKKFYFESLRLSPVIKKNNLYNIIQQINYSGGIDYNSDYDKFNYKDNSIIQPGSRPLDMHRFNFNLKAKYKKISFKSSILFNTHIFDEEARLNKEYKQPIDRIKIGVKFPYGTLNFGDYSTTFSDLTLKGTRVRGLHSFIQLGFLKLTYVRGKTKELIQSEHKIWNNNNNSELSGITLENGTFLYYEKGTPSRNLRALRTELSFDKILNFGITGLSSYDVQDVDIPYDDLYSNYLFTGNALIGTDLTLFYNNKRTWLSMETAISMTNDILDENINNYITNLTDEQSIALGAFEDLIGFPITTDLLLGKDQGRGLSIPPPIDDSLNVRIDTDYLKKIISDGTYKIKFRSPFSLFGIPFNTNAEYKRIPYSFVSFGNPSIPKDIQGLSTTLKMNLFNNKVIINLGYSNENDNVNDYKLSTTSSLGNNIGINLNFNKIPSINYSIRRLNRVDTDGLVNNITITHTIAPIYKFKFKNIKIGFNNNLVVMNYEDFLSNAGNNNFKQLSFSTSLSLSTKQLIINSGFGLSNNKPEDLQKKDTKFLALSTKISYKPKNNKISSYIGFNRVIGENTDINNTINNQKDSYKIGSQYKINDYFSIKYSSDYLIFTDNTNINNNYSEIKGKLTMKITF